MNKQNRNNFLLFIATAFGLFLLNNILLGSIVSRLPGGSATGITTMFAITWISLKLKRFFVIPGIFLIYSLIGLPSHLAVGDTKYLLAILLLIIPVLIYDFILYLIKYKISGHLLAFPLIVFLVKFSTQLLFYNNSGDLYLPEFSDYIWSLLMG